MRFVAGVLASLVAGSISVALADPPAANATSPSDTTAMTSATAPPGTPAAAATTDTDEKRLRSLGYKPEMHNGTKLWCKSEEKTGSRLGDVKHCGTSESLAHVTTNSRDMTEAAQRVQLNPQSR